jgi:hypothetical protein
MSLGFYFQKPLENAELDPRMLESDGSYAVQMSAGGTSAPLFQNAPKVAQMRVVFTMNQLYQHGGDNRTRISFDHIVASAGADNEALRKQIKGLNPATCLPAGIKIIGARAGLMQDISPAFHIRLNDHKGRSMNTKHLCVGMNDTRDARKMHIGYPLHMFSPLDPESGGIHDTNEKVPEMFRHFVMLRKEHVQDGVVLYPGVGGSGDYYAIAKTSPAAALLYHVVVEKNSHITKISNFGAFNKQFEDLNNFTQLLAPKVLFDEVRKLVIDRIQDISTKSFDCSSLEMQIDMLDVFREAHPEIGKVPIAITFEVNLHVPVHPERMRTVYGGDTTASAFGGKDDEEEDSD